MLIRMLEPEVMDSPEEARAYNAMDHRDVNRLFVSDLIAATRLSKQFDGRDSDSDLAAYRPVQSLPEILDLGTGTAQIPIELGRQEKSVRVLAIDASIAMLDVARLNVELAGLRDRIQLQHVDAKALPYGDGRFAAVMSNSIVHHLPEPLDVLEHALRVVAPGGLLFFRDLLRPASGAAVEHLVATHAAGAEPCQKAMFGASLRAALSLAEIRELVLRLGCDTQTVQATSDRHWTWSLGKPA